MITPEFLGRVHGVLAGMKETDPGYRVLRDLADMFEGASTGALVVQIGELPAVAYLDQTCMCTWTAASEVDLSARTPVTPMIQLRLMNAMLNHALFAVQAEIANRTRVAEPEPPYSLGEPGRLGGVPFTE